MDAGSHELNARKFESLGESRKASLAYLKAASGFTENQKERAVACYYHVMRLESPTSPLHHHSQFQLAQILSDTEGGLAESIEHFWSSLCYLFSQPSIEDLTKCQVPAAIFLEECKTVVLNRLARISEDSLRQSIIRELETLYRYSIHWTLAENKQKIINGLMIASYDQISSCSLNAPELYRNLARIYVLTSNMASAIYCLDKASSILTQTKNLTSARECIIQSIRLAILIDDLCLIRKQLRIIYSLGECDAEMNSDENITIRIASALLEDLPSSRFEKLFIEIYKDLAERMIKSAQSGQTTVSDDLEKLLIVAHKFK